MWKEERLDKTQKSHYGYSFFFQFKAIVKTISRSAAMKILCRAQPYISEIFRSPVAFATRWNPSIGLRISYTKMLSPYCSCFQSAHSHDGLHWEDVSSSCEGLPGGEEHTRVFYVVAARGLALLWKGVARVGQSMLRPRGLMFIGPGDPVTRSAGSRGEELWLQADRRPPFPPAYVEEEPQLLAEGGIQTAVDEGVVAGGAHSQPVKAEVKGVGWVDGLAGQQHHVAVEWEPADSKHPDHQEQHGQRSPALSSVGGVLSCCGVTDGVVAPQPAGHCGVGGSDDEERQHVK